MAADPKRQQPLEAQPAGQTTTTNAASAPQLTRNVQQQAANAAPVPAPNKTVDNSGSMDTLTKREHYALMVLQGYVAGGQTDPVAVIGHAIRAADELIAALKK